jgi:TRAP-type uncharacterized transport system substrate-binding protein
MSVNGISHAARMEMHRALGRRTPVREPPEVKANSTTPWHPGALKYFAERGVTM